MRPSDESGKTEGRKGRLSKTFFGRRKGKALRPAQSRGLEEILPALKLDLKQEAPSSLSALFSVPVNRIRLEIGFGGGEHLMHRAGEEPATGFIGVEPFVNSMAKLVLAAAERQFLNIRLYDDDAVEVLDWLPDASIDQIDLLYPDPWPKKRHWKRRFVSRANLDRFARVLKPGGRFCFASDIDTYVNWTLSHIAAHGGLVWTARNASDWKAPFATWPGTRYEAKAKREGRQSAYLTFVKP